MIVTSEYVFNNPKLDEISDIIKNTERKDNEKYRGDDEKKVEVLCRVEFIDELTYKTKSIKIIHYFKFYRIHRRIVASNNRYKVNRINELIIVIDREI